MVKKRVVESKSVTGVGTKLNKSLNNDKQFVAMATLVVALVCCALILAVIQGSQDDNGSDASDQLTSIDYESADGDIEISTDPDNIGITTVEGVTIVQDPEVEFEASLTPDTFVISDQPQVKRLIKLIATAPIKSFTYDGYDTDSIVVEEMVDTGAQTHKTLAISHRLDKVATPGSTTILVVAENYFGEVMNLTINVSWEETNVEL